jgi:CRP-like cAMP-binding protein/phosphoribosyl 1,2-cyclic phosphodiesterase
MIVRFWGTRGSVATPGAETSRFGGNTSCVEVRSGDTLVILDCGTGARPLGTFLAGAARFRAHLMLTHIHWDHIQGFPFFLPIFQPGAEMEVYGAAGLEQGLEEAMSGQMQYTYFPVRLAELRSRLTFHEVGEGSFPAGGMAVRTQFLNHSCPDLGYRLESGGVSVAYVTDHEPFWPHDPSLPLEQTFLHPGDQRHVRFAAGADLLIHDAQYTADEYPARRGWGHSTIDYVVDVAVAAGVKRLALFHHDPARTDSAVEQLLGAARERAHWRGGTLEVFAAAEGMCVDLQESAAEAKHPSTAPLFPRTRAFRIVLRGSAESRRTLREALVEDGYFLSEIPNGEDSPAHLFEPDLAVVSIPSGRNASEVVREARDAAGGRPVVAVLEHPAAESLMRELGDLAADVVDFPYTMTNLRARVRASLVRTQPLGTQLERAQRPATMDTLQATDRMSAAALETMLRAGAPCSFDPGGVLFYRGDPPGGVYYLHHGHVRAVVHAEDGREITVGQSGPGDTVGEMSALDAMPRSATVVAMEPVEATYISREAFKAALEASPEAAMRLLRILSRRLRELDERVVTSPDASIRNGRDRPSSDAQQGRARSGVRLSV